MKKQVILWLMLLAFLPEQRAQNAGMKNIPYDELAARYNTLNDRNQLMRARNVFRFETGDRKCRQEPLEVLLEKKHDDNRKRYSLYRWDASLRRWIKSGAHLTAAFCGTHDYYTVQLSCEGIYGVFEELRTTAGTLIKLPEEYKIQSLRFEQENMGVVFEWAQRLGSSQVKIPFDPVSALAMLTLEINDSRTGDKEIHKVRMGLLKAAANRDSRMVCYSADNRFIKEHFISKSLNAVK
jgi:hypothetical protein